MEPQTFHFMNAISAPLAFGLLVIFPLWRIFRRAGFHPAWSLLIFLPYVGLLLVLAMLAFARWPADPMPREVD
jgi:hypothetical protein